MNDASDLGREPGLAQGLLRAGAVVLALGALGYFVATAQLNAQPTPTPATPAPTASDADGTPPSQTPEAELQEPVPHFLHGSKSAVIFSDELGAGAERAPDATPKPAAPKPATPTPSAPRFLPSSKSLPLEVELPKERAKPFQRPDRSGTPPAPEPRNP